MNERQQDRIWELHLVGLSTRSISRETGIPKSTVHDFLIGKTHRDYDREHVKFGSQEWERLRDERYVLTSCLPLLPGFRDMDSEIEKAKDSLFLGESRVLAIGDLHCPFDLDEYLDFAIAMSIKWKTNKVVFMGDIIDNHYSSFHNTDPDGLSAHDELEYAIARLSRWNNAFPEAVVTLGNHDCYDEATEILTDDGWKKGVDLEYGENVATLNLSSGNIEYQLPEHIIKKDYKGDMIKYGNSNYIDLLVTPNHRIVYQGKDNPVNNQRYLIDSAYKVTSGYKRFPVSGYNNNSGPDISTSFIKLLAWVLTDGSISGNGDFILYQSKPEFVDKIRELLSSMDIQFRENTRYRNIDEICGKKLKNTALPAHEFYFNYQPLHDVYKERYKIPSFVYDLNTDQFEVFINTYIDGDGSRYYNSDGTEKPCSIIYGRKDILDQVQALCIQNGYSCTMRVYRDDQYKLNIVKGKINAGIQLTNSHSVIEYDGRVWCASVPNTTLVVRRNGNVQIQGNCILLRKAYASGVSKRWIRDFNDVLGVNWTFHPSIKIDGVLYQHGDGSKIPKTLVDVSQSVVQGHQHSDSYLAVKDGIFGMSVGCGVDEDSYAMAYAKGGKPPVASVGVIIDGKLPILEFMGDYLANL